MRIEMAHLRTQGSNFAVFNAEAQSHTAEERNRLLGQLVVEARRNGLRVDKAALTFSESGRVNYFGTPDLVRVLARGGVPRWTHTLTI